MLEARSKEAWIKVGGEPAGSLEAEDSLGEVEKEGEASLKEA